MDTAIRLQEWKQSVPLTLSAGSLRELAELGHLLEIRPAAGGRWTLYPKGIVGRLQLAEGTLDLLPKHPIANLCRVIGVVAEVPRLFDAVVAMDDGTLPDLLISAFVERTEALVNRGLRRDYVEQRERLAVLRGRLDMPAHVRRPEVLVADLSYRHESYTFDTPFNAVLRQTIESCHSRWPALAARVLRLRHRLAPLARADLRLADIDQFRYDRLTEPYRPIHKLCRLILAGTRLGLGAHRSSGTGFVVEMAPLFERFVSRSLQARLPAPWRVEEQDQTSLDVAGAIELRPDIVVYRGDRAVAVLDAKYKLRSLGAPTSDDAYQALAYARRHGLRRSWLVFPDRPQGAVVHTTHDQANEIAAYGLDLGAAWTDVEAALDRLASAVQVSGP